MSMSKDSGRRTPGRRPAGWLRRMAGFSLIEVLVALVVLSVGLLGLAALQAEGLRGTTTAHTRFLAVRLMTDIVDRMRANSAGAADYAVTTSGTGVGSHQCSQNGSTPAQECTATNMAQYDIFLWKQDITALLPSATASITAGADDRYTITLNWSERGENMSISTEVQM